MVSLWTANSLWLALAIAFGIRAVQQPNLCFTLSSKEDLFHCTLSVSLHVVLVHTACLMTCCLTTHCLTACCLPHSLSHRTLPVLPHAVLVHPACLTLRLTACHTACCLSQLTLSECSLTDHHLSHYMRSHCTDLTHCMSHYTLSYWMLPISQPVSPHVVLLHTACLTNCVLTACLTLCCLSQLALSEHRLSQWTPPVSLHAVLIHAACCSTCCLTACLTTCCLTAQIYCMLPVSLCTVLIHSILLYNVSPQAVLLYAACLTNCCLTACPSARCLSHHTLFYSMLPVSLNIDWLTEHLLNTSCLTTYWPTACLPVCFTSYCILPVSLEMPVLLDAVFLLNTFSFASCSLAKRFWSLLRCLSHLMFFSHHHTACLTEPHPWLHAVWWTPLNIVCLSALYLSSWTLPVSLTAFGLTASCLSHPSPWNLPFYLLNNAFLTQHRPSHWMPACLTERRV